MIEIGLGHYLTLAAIIFTIGIIGIFLNRKTFQTNYHNTLKTTKISKRM